MKTSARNQFAGTIKSIKRGDVGCIVVLALAGGLEITASITRESCDELGLEVGQTAVALIKSTGVIIATDLEHIRLSACNQLAGLVSHVERGAVNSVVTLDLENGIQITAGVTMQSTEALDLRPGQRATAVFKAGSVILGVLA
ncbi:TOBE domain-containing protein [Neisseria chenwenguii]|uniref:Transporter n=1 Tax=Neisseria chenwenguii TaxID=1853278 RepID=A0A220S4G6_9NEIS|nr:TOBE domain-containing protein [Neisseria chenwenguii]ASK28394.1 transporter [Neisseria chenwenguii]ROV55410.1 transporter [Neisseria chenwenguii]